MPATPGGLEVTKAQLLGDIAKQLDKAVTQSGADPFGFGFPWDTFDTTSHGAGLVVMAAEYDELTGQRCVRPLRLSAGSATSSAPTPGARP